MVFRYVKFLELENSQLKGRIEALEKRNQELVLALTTRSLPPVSKTAEPTHRMLKSDTTAKCSCGWSVMDTDPVKLQNEITAHYRRNVASGTNRTSWATARQKLEEQAEKTYANESS